MARIQKKVKELFQKSNEAAILAVDIYNKPATKFRSAGFIVMMGIAWTSLFHAIFERNGIKWFYREREGSRRYKYIDGEKQAWDLSTCILEYYGGENSPIRDNLKFFIALRNKIVHSFLPALDLDICGECQAHLLNYENLLLGEFGGEFSLAESLAIPLQLLSINPAWRENILKQTQSREYESVKSFIEEFRNSLDEAVWSGSEYSFRVFLVPKLGNRPQTSDVAIEFVSYDSTNPEEMEKYRKAVTFIKERKIPVANADHHRPGRVCERVESEIGLKLHPANQHVRCWRHFGVRPEPGDPNPAMTDSKYCRYDDAHGDYVYTEDWVSLLVENLSHDEKRREILGS